MEKLTCYAISRRALQLLAPPTQGNLPETWFNWLGAKPKGRAANISRITQIPDTYNKPEIVQWERDARSMGYDTCLILTLDDPLMAIQFFNFLDTEESVSPEMRLVTLGTHPAAKESNAELLDDLREPDVFLMTSFTRLRRGGVNLSDTAYANIPARDWWMLACEFKRWASLMYPAEAAAPHPDHPAMYDLNKWTVYSRRPDNAGIFKVPDTQLTSAEFFEKDCNSGLAAVANGIGSLDKPWCAETVGSDIADWSLEALAAYQLGPKGEAPKIEKVYPLRQAPTCGVAVTNTHQVIPYGGFASLIPEHQWAWDSGEVKAAITERVRTSQLVSSPVIGWLHAQMRWVREGVSGISVHGGVVASAAHKTTAKKTLPAKIVAPFSYRWLQEYDDDHRVAFELIHDGSVLKLIATTGAPFDTDTFTKLRYGGEDFDHLMYPLTASIFERTEYGAVWLCNNYPLKRQDMENFTRNENERGFCVC